MVWLPPPAVAARRRTCLSISFSLACCINCPFDAFSSCTAPCKALYAWIFSSTSGGGRLSAIVVLYRTDRSLWIWNDANDVLDDVR